MMCSFQYFNVNMSLAFEMKTFCVYEGVIKKVMTCKLRILKMGVPLFKLASCMYCLTFCQYFYCLGFMTRLAVSRCKKSSHVILRFEEN